MKCELYQFTPEVYPFNLWIYVGKDVSGMVECFNNDFSYIDNSMGATITVPYGDRTIWRMQIRSLHRIFDMVY